MWKTWKTWINLKIWRNLENLAILEDMKKETEKPGDHVKPRKSGNLEKPGEPGKTWKTWINLKIWKNLKKTGDPGRHG